jgi:hypothetical protein
MLNKAEFHLPLADSQGLTGHGKNIEPLHFLKSGKELEALCACALSDFDSSANLDIMLFDIHIIPGNPADSDA